MPARRFGNVRKLPSGRYQARWEDTDGTEHKAPATFAEAAEARRWLSAQETDRHRGDWVDPDKGRTTLRAYADEWLDGKPDEDVGPRTRDLYRSLLKHHVLPTLGSKSLSAIDTATVKASHTKLLRSGVGRGDSRQVLSPAPGDPEWRHRGWPDRQEPVHHKGCRRGEDHGRAEACHGRPGAHDRWRHRAAVPGSRPAGSVLRAPVRRAGCARTRQRIDLEAATVTVTESALELADGSRVIGDPKTEHSVRTVTLPAHLVSVLADHLEQYVGPEKSASCSPARRAPIRRGNFHKVWARARDGAEMPETFHFHDLRHTGKTLAAATGASTAQLMARMGHASPRAAAMIYQHATEEGDRAIAAALDAMIATAGR